MRRVGRQEYEGLEGRQGRNGKASAGLYVPDVPKQSRRPAARAKYAGLPDDGKRKRQTPNANAGKEINNGIKQYSQAVLLGSSPAAEDGFFIVPPRYYGGKL